MAKKSIPKIDQLSNETRELYNILNEEDDLPVILVGTGFLDASLSSILETKFITSSVARKILDPRGGALGSFSAGSENLKSYNRLFDPGIKFSDPLIPSFILPIVKLYTPWRQ